MEEFYKGLHNFLLEYWLLLSTVISTISMAVLRTAKDKGRVDWIEAAMCGIFAYGIWLLLGFVNLPDGAGVFIGGIVGYKGTHFVSARVNKMLGIEEEKHLE